MDKIFNNLNQTGNLLNDQFGQDIRILEDGQAFFKTLVVEDQIDITGNKIINVATPVDSMDCANKSYVDSVAGGIIGGAVNGNQLINNTVSLAKMSVLSANSIIGNNTGLTATPLALSTANVKTMLDLTGTNSGDQSLTGDVTSTGTSVLTTTIANSAVTNAKLGTKSVTLDKIANIATATLIGNKELGNNSPSALTTSQVKTMLDLTGTNTGDQSLTGDVTSTGTSVLTTTIASGSVSLGKMATLAANSIIGNNTGLTATPLALSTANVKTMLDLTGTNSGDQSLTGDVTSTGTSVLTTTIANDAITTIKIANDAVTRLKIVDNAINMAKLAHIAANTIIGNNTGITGAPLALSTADVKTMLGITLPSSAIVGISDNQTLTNKIINGDQLVLNSVTLSRLTSIAALSILGNKEFTTGVPQVLSDTQVKTILSLQNVDNISINSWAGSGNITTVGAVASGSLASGFGTINCGSITSDSITAKTTNANLTLNGNGTGTVTTNNSQMNIYSTVSSTDSSLNIGGPTITNSRYIGCYQNSIYKLSFGLSASAHFFIYDGVNARNLFIASITAGNIKFPTYTTDGTVSFSGGDGTIIRSSDRRLKQDEEDLIPAISLQKILNLQPKKYRWISNPTKENIGFIAQDVELSIPEAVDGKKFEYEFMRDGVSQGVDGTVRVDEEGEPILDINKPRYRGLDQCAILSTLVSAFQELVQKNNLLEARITVLESYEYVEA